MTCVIVVSTASSVDIGGCISLVALPHNMGKSLPRLKRLKMKACKRLQMLLNSIGLLTELEHLNLQDCSNFITLINAITELVSLKKFIPIVKITLFPTDNIGSGLN